MFAQMRAAAGLLRAGEWQGTRPPAQSHPAEVLASATINGAQACWLEDAVGSLTPGKWADLVVYRPSRPVSTLDEAFAQVVWMGHPSRLESVLVGGVEALAPVTQRPRRPGDHPHTAYRSLHGTSTIACHRIALADFRSSLRMDTADYVDDGAAAPL